ncbi:vanillate O-demethylase oxidoreductase VanB [Solimonas sp. K1W22B-7]|uniref:SRPBCC family protein n=1 Tax=Solimonas sp. K1W22B-7 TaxID=2303331 RepID=UPI000E332CAE|nr:SRPBCC family protein [Solimonas sp. K1W22B-7]AXQ27751.1 vanillate O-demethylase oxidoreductase VanB [Solimonas sp. K1W22B-7]
MTESTDRIEKQVLLKATRERVWRAVSHAPEFGQWFGVDFSAVSFAVGAQASGHITHPGYEHLLMTVTVESIEPQRRIAWRWHPNAIEPGRDYSAEPTTLIEFVLEDAPGGILLKVTESGFDRIPLPRRREAYRGNEEGWTEQMNRIDAWLDGRL